MGKLTEHQGTKYVKGLLLGNPGTGKTGGLTSLVRAGYKLRIWDFDNLLVPLIKYVQKDCPDKIDNVRYQAFTDKLKGPDQVATMQGKNLYIPSPVDGIPQAYPKALRQLNKWVDGTEDLGIPAQWGADTFVIIDTLTTMARAAYRYCDAINPMAADKRNIFFGAQQLVMNMLNLLASDSFNTNVLVLAHLDYDTENDLTKGFPKSIGSAIKGEIAAGFNCVLLFEAQGSGPNMKRIIRTNSTGIVDLKNPVSFKIPDTLPIETGLADFVKGVLTN